LPLHWTAWFVFILRAILYFTLLFIRNDVANLISFVLVYGLQRVPHAEVAA
jgi:hypothetical protein